MASYVDDLIMHASEEAAARSFRLDNPGVTLGNSGWEGFCVTFRNTIDNSWARVFLSFLPQYYRGEKDGFSLTVQERQLAYDELAMYGVNVENFVIESAEMFIWPFETDKQKTPTTESRSGREGNVVSAVNRPATYTEKTYKENRAGDKMSKWLSSHSLAGSDDTFAWSSKSVEKEL